MASREQQGGAVLRWPRGKYNGQRIVGFAVKIRINVLVWRWKPLFRWNFGQPAIGWLCVLIHGEPQYD